MVVDSPMEIKKGPGLVLARLMDGGSAFHLPRLACASSPASEKPCHLAQGLRTRWEADSNCGKGDAVKAPYFRKLEASLCPALAGCLPAQAGKSLCAAGAGSS